MQTSSNMLTIAQGAWLHALKTARVIVDATSGAGKDTLFLAQNKQDDAHIYAFDVQPTAMLQTKNTTREFSGDITYILDSHENIGQTVESKLDLVVFNLGYLPGGDHSITTVPEVTVKAVESVLKNLAVNGLLSIMVYPGHPSGKEEGVHLMILLEELPKEDYSVVKCQLTNHDETAPYLYLVEKVR
ncbi:MAG: class I SAM-dependent methyltransferase [Anaerovibrio sp.]|uniref:tRNA (mnm(5)s(2)U34)-methyltransferase n=1 Tax=Anaerovibrio sp. TaxID=1872532 RepID=UPI0025FFDE48|nr:class I SAM-dependent methyltransferase [Anaerovibrio sp.]MCR5175841.1 class I SAM-dependent methyltransferase [Anaerovibrio sp.]